MNKKQIQKLADDLAKLYDNIEMVKDNKQNWLNISNEIKKHPDLVKRLKNTNPEELREKGFITFFMCYNLMCQTFNKKRSI